MDTETQERETADAESEGRSLVEVAIDLVRSDRHSTWDELTSDITSTPFEPTPTCSIDDR